MSTYRVLQATVAALARGDFREVGMHMTASHDSLRDDYQVSAEPYRIPIRALPVPYHTPVLHAPILSSPPSVISVSPRR